MSIPADENKTTESAALDALVDAYIEMRKNSWGKTSVREYHRKLLNAATVRAAKEGRNSVGRGGRG